MIQKTYKYRIYPTTKQQVLIEKHFGCARFVYNWALEQSEEHYKKTGKSLRRHKKGEDCLQVRLKGLKEEHEWLSEVSYQSLFWALLNLETAYKNFFRRVKNGEKPGYPKFKSKRNRQSFSTSQDNKVDFDESLLYITKFREGIKTEFHRRFEGDVKTVTISRTPTGKYYASILVETPENLPKKPEVKDVIGIDMGLSHFAVLSNGEKIPNPKYLIKSEERLQRAQRRLSKRKKGSNNRAKQRLVVARLHEKVYNQRRNFLHKLSHRLIRENQADTICVESLGIRGMVKNSRLAKSISDVGWFTFKEFLRYKSDWYGKNLIEAPRNYPSSKLCSNCGYKNDELKLYQRSWQCPSCRFYHDRDLNAANNLKKYATPGTGGSNACGDDKVTGSLSEPVVVAEAGTAGALPP